MYTETALFDLLLPGDSRSLKQKRAYVRPIIAALRKFEVSVAEVGAHELWGRAQIGMRASRTAAMRVRFASGAASLRTPATQSPFPSGRVVT